MEGLLIGWAQIAPVQRGFPGSARTKREMRKDSDETRKGRHLIRHRRSGRFLLVLLESTAVTRTVENQA